MDNTVVIGDLHFGRKNFSLKQFEDQIGFFVKQFFPYLLQKNIKRVICLGDLFEHRTKQDINILLKVEKEFLNFFEENEIEFIVILGNHDMYFQNRKDVSTLDLFSHHKFLKVIKEPTLITIDEVEWELVPWLMENETFTPRSEYIMGHFEINGFYMTGKYKCTHGKNLQDLLCNGNIKKIVSGHFHNKQENEIVLYAGTPYAMDWSDKNSDKGFYHMINNELVFIDNKYNKKYYVIEQTKEVTLYPFFVSENVPLLDEEGNQVMAENVEFSYFIDENEIGAEEVSQITSKNHYVKMNIQDQGDLKEIIIGDNTTINIRIPEIIKEHEIIEDDDTAIDKFVKDKLSAEGYEFFKTVYKAIAE